MTGDVIYVFGEMDEDGFYMGQLGGSGARGLVPSNFLAEAAVDHMSATVMGGGGSGASVSSRRQDERTE